MPSGKGFESLPQAAPVQPGVVIGISPAFATEALGGPVNVVAPRPLTNAEFTRTLARVLRRPALFAAPVFAVRLVMGEFGAEILGGQRIRPAKLLASGFAFRYPTLEEALRHLVG